MALRRRARGVPRWILPLALAVATFFLPLIYSDYSVVRQVELALILSLLVSGLNLSLGYAGELALGQAAMYAGGAYAAGYAAVRWADSWPSDLVVQLLIGGLVALVVGIVTGIPGLRLGSWSLAMTSFFLVLLVPDVISIFSDQTGGHNGLTGIPPPRLFGWDLSMNGYFQVIVVVTSLWFVVMRNVAVSRHGTALRVLKQSPVLAASMGINVFRMKLLAYALGAIPAGLAGALFANLDLYISPQAFSFGLATTVLAASILGGSTSVYGAILGAAVLQFGLNQSGSYDRYSLLVTGAFLVVGGVLLTGGLSGLARSAWTRRFRPRDLPAETAGATDLPPLEGAELRVEGASKSFGGNRALSAVTFGAKPGQITALIGPNGSGKTTLLNLICAFYRIDEGVIRLAGNDLHGLGPDRVARAGVGRTFQTPNIPADITVLEAVMSGRYAAHRATVVEAVLRLPHYRKVRREDRDEAMRVLDLVGIGHLRHHVAQELPLGQRRLLEVARCVVARPGVLLLDEVASGLDEHEVERLSEVILRIRDAGGTVVLVEHNFRLVMSIADEVVALAHGQVMATGTPARIEADPRVRSEYLGVQADEAGSAPPGGER